jgi:hypothetical protein
VKPFLDLTGASGSVYRFRRCGDLNELPATAGNFVYLRADPAGDEIVCCGTARSLVRASSAWKAAERRKATDLYLRLNVSRAVREGEHEDIVAATQPPLVLTEFE